MTALADPWEAAWSAALDALELEADAVERMLRHRDMLLAAEPDRAVFTPPAGLGPLPLALTERARRLMQRQLDLSRELSIAIAGNRQQSRLVARLQREGGTGHTPPVFVDNRT
ncbi:hypothetical protein [Dactylosporangium sp. CA-092794]|uniref:hypothetical protein n=1 Tax=Dactylosporangium sp. CA-092794 TaxID=3239929 RepID=UPI003D92BC0D